MFPPKAKSKAKPSKAPPKSPPLPVNKSKPKPSVRPLPTKFGMNKGRHKEPDSDQMGGPPDGDADDRMMAKRPFPPKRPT